MGTKDTKRPRARGNLLAWGAVNKLPHASLPNPSGKVSFAKNTRIKNVRNRGNVCGLSGGDWRVV